MKLVTILAVAAASCVVSASPLRKRQLSNSGNNDITILNFALLLEQLEFEFYKAGLKKFGEADFRRANIPNPSQAILNFHHILQHEAKHVETLQSVIQSLGGEPAPACEFKFPMETVQDFTKLASVLEKTGVAAYNGAVNLLKNPDLQTAAANIDTIEARHASFLQTVNGLDPFPADFDVSLDGRQVVTLAAPVIKSCPFELPFAPFGALKVDQSKVLLPGEKCSVKFKRAGKQQHFCNFVFSDQSLVSKLSDDDKCKIPKEARGDVFLMITSSKKGVTLKDTNAVVAGPVVMDIDTAHDDSCQRFVGKDEDHMVDSFMIPAHQMPKERKMKKQEMPKEKLLLPAEDCTSADALPEEEKGKMGNKKMMPGAIPPEIQAQINEIAKLKEEDTMMNKKMEMKEEEKKMKMKEEEKKMKMKKEEKKMKMEEEQQKMKGEEQKMKMEGKHKMMKEKTPAQPEGAATGLAATTPPAQEVPRVSAALDAELKFSGSATALGASAGAVLDMSSMASAQAQSPGGETPQM